MITLLRVLFGFIRVLFGFIIACLVAGLVTVAFVVTPADIAGLSAEAQPERLGNAGVLSLLAATHSAIFAFPFAIIGIGIAEMSGIRTWIYYAFFGVAIALGGLAAEYANEVAGQPSILNGYAVAAYVTVGLAGGLAYWLLAGRRAGGKRADGVPARRAAADRSRTGAPGELSRPAAVTRNCVVASQQSV